METINKEDLIECLKNSKLTKSFDDVIVVPKAYMLNDLKINNENDFYVVLNKLRYWMVSGIPEEIFDYLRHNDVDLTKKSFNFNGNVLTTSFEDFHIEELKMFQK